MNAVKSPFFSEATSSEMISPELLAIDVRVGLSTLQEETVDSLISPLLGREVMGSISGTKSQE